MRPARLAPRLAAKCRVLTTRPRCSGRVATAIASAAVMWAWQTSERPSRRTDRSASNAVVPGSHCTRFPRAAGIRASVAADDGNLPAAACRLDGDVADVALDAGEVSGRNDVDHARHRSVTLQRSDGAAKVQESPASRLRSALARQHECTCDGAEACSDPIQQPASPPVPLPNVGLLCRMKQCLASSWVRARACARVLGDGIDADGRCPASLTRSPLPIGLLRVEEETLVEQTDIVDGLARQQERGTDDESSACRQTPEPERLGPHSRRRRERPADALVLRRRARGGEALPPLHAGSLGGARTRLSSRMAARRQHGVRIQEQDIDCPRPRVEPRRR